MDGSSNEGGTKASIMLISEDHHIDYALKFGFKASNNKGKYEVLLIRLWLAQEIPIQGSRCDKYYR